MLLTRKSPKRSDFGICRRCHASLHKRFSEIELAKQLNNIEAIQSEPALSEYFDWVAKQKVQKFMAHENTVCTHSYLVC